MSTEQDKAKIVGFVEQVINQDQWDRVDQYVAPDSVDHTLPPGVPPNIDGVRQFFTMFRGAFPDLKYTIQETLADGELIAQRVTGDGTMKGSFLGMPATGKHATWDEVHIVRLRDGKIVEHWGNVDQMNMMMQLGLASLPGSPAAQA